MSQFEHVSYFMIGRIAMQPREAELVEKYASQCSSWLEIGTLWGGSAILAALTRPDIQVTCIDPMHGYYGDKDMADSQKRTPSVAALQDNLHRFGVSERVTLLEQSSDPFPEVEADGILVDGAHDYDSVLHDVQAACAHARKWILCHDINDEVVNDAVNAGLAWGVWREVEASPCMRVFEHESLRARI